MISQAYVNELFEYREGVLYWKVNKARAKAGAPVGNLNNHGYIHTKIDGQRYRNHQLIYLMHHGYIPKQIDHIDRNRTNNRIENLRACTQTENLYNTGVLNRSSTGVKGVNWHNASKKWMVRINVKKKTLYLGIFDSFEEASVVATEARSKHHGEFARHN